MTERLSGSVVRLLVDKGFGFVEGPDGTEYFFHRSAMDPLDFLTIGIGTVLSFEPVAMSPKGPRAEAVQLGRV